MKNVLIFPAGSMIGLELYKHIAYLRSFKVFGGTSIKDHGNFVFENLISGLPFITDDDFLPELNKAIEEYEIDFIFPTSDRGMLLFSKWDANGLIRRAKVMCSSPETCQTAYSKTEIYRVLDGVVQLPKIYPSPTDIDGFPVFVKPIIGTGAVGTHIARSSEELRFYLDFDPDLLIMEYLPGMEYTVDCFTDRKGELRFSKGRSKTCWIHGRFTGHMEEVNDPRIQDIAQKINSKLKFTGPWFYQIKENAQGDFILLEFAARIEGGTSFFLLNGVNLPLLALKDALCEEFEIHENGYSLEMDRSLWHYRYEYDLVFDTVILENIDCLFHREKINHKLLSVLLKFKAEGKSITLQTFKGLEERNHPGINLIPLGLFENMEDFPNFSQWLENANTKNMIYIGSDMDKRITYSTKFGMPVFDIGQAIELFLNW